MKPTNLHDDEQPRISVSHDELACVVEVAMRSNRNAVTLPADPAMRAELLGWMADDLWLCLCRRDWEEQARRLDERDRNENT
jgi:hypothetical protein